MGKVKDGNKRIMITLPESLIDKLEKDTAKRGLDLSKSTRIQLALEKELKTSPAQYIKSTQKDKTTLFKWHETKK